MEGWTQKKKKIEKVGSLFGLELAQKSMSPQFYWDEDTMGWRFPSFIFWLVGEKINFYDINIDILTVSLFPMGNTIYFW